MITKEQWLEKWNAEDQRCYNCHQVVTPARGFNKQNLKRLFIGKPSVQDWTFFFIILATLFMAYLYNIETAQCRNVLNNLDAVCSQYGYSLISSAAGHNSSLSSNYTAPITFANLISNSPAGLNKAP